MGKAITLIHSFIHSLGSQNTKYLLLTLHTLVPPLSLGTLRTPPMLYLKSIRIIKYVIMAVILLALYTLVITG